MAHQDHRHSVPMCDLSVSLNTTDGSLLSNQEFPTMINPCKTLKVEKNHQAMRSRDEKVVKCNRSDHNRNSNSNSMEEREEGVYIFRSNSVVEKETPFDLHLREIYEGTVSEEEGLSFFESNGYYDLTEANTVEMFRQNLGMEDIFWLQSKSTKSSLNRMEMLLLEGKEDFNFDAFVETEMSLEIEKEQRLMEQSREIDHEEMLLFQKEQQQVQDAIENIQKEQKTFQTFFYQAFMSTMNTSTIITTTTTSTTSSSTLSLPPSSSSNNLDSLSLPTWMMLTPENENGGRLYHPIQLPPYSGHVYLLKHTIPFVFRSWHKRWFYLDFTMGIVHMYKRRYWKSPRGSIDLKQVRQIEYVNTMDLYIHFYDQEQFPSMLIRLKTPQEADLWKNLLTFAQKQVGSNFLSTMSLPPSSSSSTSMSSTDIVPVDSVSSPPTSSLSLPPSSTTSTIGPTSSTSVTTTTISRQHVMNLLIRHVVVSESTPSVTTTTTYKPTTPSDLMSSTQILKPTSPTGSLGGTFDPPTMLTDTLCRTMTMTKSPTNSICSSKTTTTSTAAAIVQLNSDVKAA